MSSAPTSPAIARAASALARGENVVIPTETVYGLAGNALDARAVARIFEIKGRPHFNPLIVHVGSEAQLQKVVSSVPEPVRRLMGRFWPGPLTVVLPRHAQLPELVTAGLATVAVRMPDHPIALECLRRADVPLAAPSANRFGEVSPTERGHITGEIEKEVATVLDGGPCRIGIESTIVAFLDGKFRLLRPGGLEVERIEAVIGAGRLEAYSGEVPLAPGMLKRHYSPATPCRFDETGRAAPRPGKAAGCLSLLEPDDADRFVHVEVLSPRGDLAEAAARLFASMRRLDATGLEEILLRAVPSRGLGLAINDRLRRAAAP